MTAKAEARTQEKKRKQGPHPYTAKDAAPVKGGRQGQEKKLQNPHPLKRGSAPSQKIGPDERVRDAKSADAKSADDDKSRGDGKSKDNSHGDGDPSATLIG